MNVRIIGAIRGISEGASLVLERGGNALQMVPNEFVSFPGKMLLVPLLLLDLRRI